MNANEIRGEVAVVLEGETFVLRPAYEAIVAFESKTGMSLLQLGNAAGDGSMTQAAAAIVATECIKAWGSATDHNVAKHVNAKRIGELLIEAGFIPILKRIELMLFLAATGGYTASGEVKATGMNMMETPVAG